MQLSTSTALPDPEKLTGNIDYPSRMQSVFDKRKEALSLLINNFPLIAEVIFNEFKKKDAYDTNIYVEVVSYLNARSHVKSPCTPKNPQKLAAALIYAYLIDPENTLSKYSFGIQVAKDIYPDFDFKA